MQTRSEGTEHIAADTVAVLEGSSLDQTKLQMVHRRLTKVASSCRHERLPMSKFVARKALQRREKGSAENYERTFPPNTCGLVFIFLI